MDVPAIDEPSRWRVVIDQQRWNRIKDLFDAAVRLRREERPAFLTEACGTDPQLRAEVDSLLDAHERAAGFAETPALDGLRTVDASAITADASLRVLHAGDTVGPYRIHAFIAAGGMGEVYRAQDDTLGREVAIKVLPAEQFEDEEKLARFAREARILAALNHPNIATIYGVERLPSTVAGGAHALVLEFVEGETLAERLATGALPIRQALGVALQMAAALDAAHQKGVIHRDLKPANIKITPAGTVKVLDFGVAKFSTDPIDLDQRHETAPLTAERRLIGTAAYMSPEQARGDALDRRTDIWAFGCLLYEMLSGVRPFPGRTASDTIAAIIERQPDWSMLPERTPSGLRSLIRHCLQKDRDVRLRDVADGRLQITDALSALEHSSSRSREGQRRPRVFYVAAVLLGAGVLLVAGRDLVGPGAPPLPEVRLQFVTPQSDDRTTFAISPDGHSVVFHTTDPLQLWLRPLSAEAAMPLPGTEGATLGSQFWSPDSHSVGFFANELLKRIDLTTGLVRVLAEAPNSRGGTWSSSGHILFASSNGPLYRVSAEGGERTAVTQLLPGQTNHRFPQFLPDSNEFLFFALGRAGSNGIYAGALGSSDMRWVGDADSAAQFIPPGHLLFARQGALWAAPFDRQRRQVVGEPLPIAHRILTHPTISGWMGFSASNEAIVYRSGAARWQFSWVDRAGREREVTAVADVEQPGAIRLSPDGRTILMRGTTAGNTDIWAMDVARRSLQRLTSHSAIDEVADMSADGTQLVFASDRAAGISDLYLRRLDGEAGEALLLETPEQKQPVDWSADGRYILYVSQSTTTGLDLWALPLFGDRTPRVVARTPFADGATVIGGAEFSPDGRWVAYQSSETGRGEIYVQSFPEPSTRIRLSSDGGTAPRWGSDGGELFYRDANSRLMAVTVHFSGATLEAGASVPLFALPPQSEYAVAADGRFLINKVVADAPPATILLNWKPSTAAD